MPYARCNKRPSSNDIQNTIDHNLVHPLAGNLEQIRRGLHVLSGWVRQKTLKISQIQYVSMQMMVFRGGNGGHCRIRTYDRSIKSRMLYQLS